MNIINPRVSDDLRSGKKLRLNLGAGGADAEGRYAVDHLELPGVDIVADLNSALDDLPDDSVSEIVTSHTFEHVENLMGLMHEIHRVVAPDGSISIVVPHFSSTLAYSDPTHVRFFGLYTMGYFADAQDQPETRHVPNFYTALRFRIESVQIHFYEWGTPLRRRLGRFMTRFWNKSAKRQHFYECHLAYLYPADEIWWILSPKKPAAD
jgi:predicted SAM-dependent methyltransferase